MQNNEREIEVNGKIYTLTVRRSIVYKIATIVPEVLKIYKKSKQEGKEVVNGDEISQDALVELLNESTIDKLYDNMNVIFYELIKVKHNISFEKSNEIYANFNKEYNDVDDKLMSLIEKVFTQGIPREKKKNLNW